MPAIAFGLAHRLPALMSSLPSLMVPVSGAVVRFLRWRTERKTIKALQSLDDRVLKDIGLVRSEISSVVRDLSGQRRRQQETSK